MYRYHPNPKPYMLTLGPGGGGSFTFSAAADLVGVGGGGGGGGGGGRRWSTTEFDGPGYSVECDVNAPRRTVPPFAAGAAAGPQCFATLVGRGGRRRGNVATTHAAASSS